MKINKLVFLLSAFIVIVVSSCGHDKKHPKITDNNKLPMRIFKSQVFQDSLKAFISATDSFPIPADDTLIYSISLLNTNKTEQKLRFNAGVYAMTPVICRQPLALANMAGACKFDNKFFAISYTGDKSILSFLDSTFLSSLDSSLYLKLNNPIRLDRYADIQTSFRIYKIFSADSLQLMLMHRSRYEKSFSHEQNYFHESH